MKVVSSVIYLFDSSSSSLELCALECLQQTWQLLPQHHACLWFHCGKTQAVYYQQKKGNVEKEIDESWMGRALSKETVTLILNYYPQNYIKYHLLHGNPWKSQKSKFCLQENQEELEVLLWLGQMKEDSKRCLPSSRVKLFFLFFFFIF